MIRHDPRHAAFYPLYCSQGHRTLQTNRPDPSVVPGPSNRTFMPTQSGALLSRGVSIKGSVKFLNELLIDGEVEGTINSTGTLTIGEHARIRGEIRTNSVRCKGRWRAIFS